MFIHKPFSVYISINSPSRRKLSSLLKPSMKKCSILPHPYFSMYGYSEVPMYPCLDHLCCVVFLPLLPTYTIPSGVVCKYTQNGPVISMIKKFCYIIKITKLNPLYLGRLHLHFEVNPLFLSDVVQFPLVCGVLHVDVVHFRVLHVKKYEI